MPSKKTLQRIEEEAVDWLIQLKEAQPEDATHQAFEHWQQQDTRHRQVAQDMKIFMDKLQLVQTRNKPAATALRTALAKPRRSITRTAMQLALLCGLLLPLLMYIQPGTLPPLFADLRTAPAEWRSQQLEDGSQLHLAGRTAVKIRFDEQGRRIELLKGEILIDVASDARPLQVITRQGHFQALGTRFIVRQDEQTARLTLLESRVLATHPDGSQRTAQAGQQLALTPKGIQPLADINPELQETAWHRRQLLVQDTPLTEVLDEINRQHRGLLRYDAEALADLRVSSILPRQDSQRALQLIADALPVRVRQITPWLILVDRQP